jgi:hypothetical protein
MLTLQLRNSEVESFSFVSSSFCLNHYFCFLSIDPQTCILFSYFQLLISPSDTALFETASQDVYIGSLPYSLLVPKCIWYPQEVF